MTLKVGETNPVVTVDIGINVAKLNKAQIQMLIKEHDMYKLNNERMLKENDFLRDTVKDTFKESTKMLTQREGS